MGERWWQSVGRDRSQFDAVVEFTLDRSTDALASGFSEATPVGEASSGRGSEGTVGICVADRSGNLVALTDTILGYFGSSVRSSLGFYYNNGMFGFAPDGGTNSAVPGIAPLSNMSPAIVYRDGRAICALSGSGGRAISAAVAQVLACYLQTEMSLQECIDFPRVDWLSGPVVDYRLADQLGPVENRLRLASVNLAEEDLTSGYFANVVGIEKTSEGDFQCAVNSLHPSQGCALT